ncbi:MAG: DNA (cytosine-5-)-methyltransferase [Allorhizobium sp.]
MREQAGNRARTWRSFTALSPQSRGGMTFRFLSVCSGIEAASVAWKPLGWECAGVSEIDKFPRAVLQHRLGAVPVEDDHRWQPGQNFTPLFGDFTQIEAHHVGPVDLLVGGTPCFPEGTMIASTRGLIPIEAVQIGDEVLTHEHRFRRVLRTGSKMAETVEVTGQGHHGFVTTANHPFLARQKMGQSTRVDGRAVRKTWITDADWVAAEHMEGKHWACVSRWPEMPMPPIAVIGNETVPRLPVRDLMMIAGAYLGDGWIRSNERRGAVMFGLNPSKLDALRPAFDAYGKWHGTQERTVVKVGICSRPLARWLAENFGSGAANKRVPMWVLGHPERDALMQGYLLTDGGKADFGHRATTISPDLALTMRMLAVSCGYSSSVTFTERPSTHHIEGHTVNQSDTYTVSFGTSARSSFEDGGFRWQRVRSVQPTGRVERVYDLEVEEDHSYVADGICVHNCQSFSIAGKRLGLDDPRGNLTLEFFALAERVRPTWIVWENVPGVLSHDDGRTFGTVLGLMGECGFRWAYRTLDAQHVRTRRFGRAVPQRRRRVFLVGYSGTADIHPRAVLFDRESLRGNPAPRREAGQGVATDVAPSLVSSGRGVERAGETRGQDPVIAARMVAFGEYVDDGTASVMKARDFKDATDLVAHALRGEGFDASEDGTGRAPTIAFTAKDHGGDAVENISPTLRAGGHTGSHANAGVMPAIAFPAEMSATQCASTEELSPALSVTHTTAMASAWGVRRLTPTECARLQGFPDDWARIPWRGRPAEECPDGPQYKAFGNSMALPPMIFIGERIEAIRHLGNQVAMHRSCNEAKADRLPNGCEIIMLHLVNARLMSEPGFRWHWERSHAD